jgi:hypothetical protein
MILPPIDYRKHPRFSCLYKISGTETFRLSSTKILSSKRKNVVHGNWGDNAQNKDKNIRYIWIPDEGRKFGQFDQAGAEALIVAYECKPGKFRDLFLYDVKPHTYIAGKIFINRWRLDFPYVDEIYLIPIKEIKNHPGWKVLADAIAASDNEPMRYYYLGKKTVHGGNYDMRGNTMVTVILEETDGAVNISSNEGDRFIQTYHTTFPEIRRDFHLGCVDEATKNQGIIRNLFGFPREFTGHWGDGTFREMFAFKPQSTVGSITNIALTKIQEDIWDNNIPYKDWQLDILQNGHDSGLFQWRDDPGVDKEIIPYIKPHFEPELISSRGEKYKMKSEVQTGYNWKPQVKVKDKAGNVIEIINPRGLVEYKVAS